jgi:rhodanese-related sulfurtransferase
MKKTLVVLTGIALVVALAIPTARAQKFDKVLPWADWIDSVVLAALDRVLSAMPGDAYQLEPAAAHKHGLSEKTLILDVREFYAQEDARLTGAVHIPLSQLARQTYRLPADRNAPILVFCQNGVRGTMALTALRAMGYTNVQNLRGGLDAWDRGRILMLQQVGK